MGRQKRGREETSGGREDTERHAEKKRISKEEKLFFFFFASLSLQFPVNGIWVLNLLVCVLYVCVSGVRKSAAADEENWV